MYYVFLMFIDGHVELVLDVLSLQPGFKYWARWLEGKATPRGAVSYRNAQQCPGHGLLGRRHAKTKLRPFSDATGIGTTVLLPRQV